MDDDVDRGIARHWEEGRAAFPGVSIERDAFARFLLERTSDAARIEKLRGAELYLACGCAAGDARAIALLEERYLARIPAFLSSRERSRAVIDEVQQRVRMRLLIAAAGEAPKVADFAGTGPLEGWLRVVTIRVYIDLRRQARSADESAGDEGAPLLAASPDPELLLLRERCRGSFETALRDAFAALPSRDRALFRMQFRRGLTLDQMALVFRVHRATAARWTLAARDRLRSGTASRLCERLGADGGEISSLLRDLRSQLDVSLDSLLRETGEG